MDIRSFRRFICFCVCSIRSDISSRRSSSEAASITIVISARERRSTPGTMYSPSPHGKPPRRTAAPDRHDLFTFHRFHCSRSSWTGAFICGCATSRRDFPITKFFSCRINGKDFKRRTVHPEPDIASGKGKSVNPFGIILIGWSRIKGQNLTQRLPFACGKSLQGLSAALAGSLSRRPV